MTTSATDEQRAQAEQLRQWHRQPPILVLPNAWDAASARLFEVIGFRAVATTSSGVASALGYPDGERMSRAQMIEAIARITHAVSVPVTADIESGYGATLEQKLSTIREVIATGAVGINIEDSAQPDRPELVEIAAQVEVIRAIRDAAAAWGAPLVINARTDGYLSHPGDEPGLLEETIQRGNAYLAAGADCVYPIGARDAGTIGTLAKGIAGPINILAGPQTPTIPELEALGVARVSVGGGLTRVALGAVRRAAEELLRQGTFTHMAQDALPSAEFQRLFEGAS
ncbi:MAG TPA: isocitrate lyase/phosphoenolpyruvate mutase family protein [Ktedonobacterales bacterium]|nr:isocitrate lyase/phosphoenolpyruvate mutase family protein [Ktedonobacterales bacterium]